MIKLGGLIDLKPLQEEKAFTATSKETGNVSVFKTKAARDAAIKAGSHEKRKTDKDTAVDVPGGEDKPKVNIFNKDKKEPKKAKSSSSEPDYDKYTSKAQTVTDFIKGDLSTDDIQKIADKNFNSQVATPKELDDFLNNKFIQGMMADKYGVDKDEMVSKVKDLKTALFGGDKEEPAKEEPKQDEPAKDSTGDRAGNSVVNKKVRAKAKKLGITPQKLGKEEYQKKMSQAAVAAITDSNFHSEARALIAKLEGKPEWAEDPRKSAPDISSPEYDEWRKSSVYSSEYYDADDDTEDLGVSASQEARWDGRDALDSIAFDLKMNGFKNLASTLQSVVQENKSTRLKLGKLLPEEVLNEGPSTEEKRIAMLAVRKQAKFRSVSLEQAIQDQINALEDLMRDAKRGKLK